MRSLATEHSSIGDLIPIASTRLSAIPGLLLRRYPIDWAGVQLVAAFVVNAAAGPDEFLPTSTQVEDDEQDRF